MRSDREFPFTRSHLGTGGGTVLSSRMPFMKNLISFGILIATSPLWCPEQSLASTGEAGGAASPSIRNLLRNASFELPHTFNGSPMRQGTELVQNSLARQGKCQPLPIEGWWQSGSSTGGVSLEKSQAHSGSISLALNATKGSPASIFSAPEVPVPAGPVTLSAWVRTAQVNGKLEIEFVPAGLKPSDVPRSLSKKCLVLPVTTAEWTRVSLTANAPENVAVVAGIISHSGQVIVDDVQLETGPTSTPFAISLAEALRLSFKGVPPENLPFWKEKVEGAQELHVRNESLAPITGTLEIWAGPWPNPKAERMALIEDLALAPGAVQAIPLSLGKLPPDAYVVVPVLKQNGEVVLDGASQVDADTLIGGDLSNSMLKSQAAIRFAITPDIAPAKVFGVGNGMLPYGWEGNSGNWSGGWPLKLYAFAKGEGFSCGRGQRLCDDQAYLFAAAGVPFHRMENPNIAMGAPGGARFEGTGATGNIDFWNPEGMAFLKAKAEKIGKENARNPAIASYQMGNETFFAFKDGLCATLAADAHFRAWCKERYSTLDKLNQHWGTSYKTWDEVEQPASAKYAGEIKGRQQAQGSAAIDWTASLGNITPEIHARIKSIPGRGMDWFRWRTRSSLWMYGSFRDAAKKHDSKTLYSTNLCWPNFWPQMSMPFYRMMDVTMLDCQYTSGIPESLGTPQEMMEIMEAAESNSGDKPIWGIEIYSQPRFPGDFTALQNWGVLAHGITNNLVFAWGPYSDVGIPKTTRAWEKPHAPHMWMLIDLDGTKLPSYAANKRSQEEIRKFHAEFNGLSLKRVPTDIAFFVSQDTSEYISYETASKPWGSLWTRTRNNLSYLLRMNGITADFVDDETLPSGPGKFQMIIVPASYALSQESAGKLAGFARAGGTVILAGISGVVDPWAKKYANLGGPAWADLAWKARNFQQDIANVDFIGDIKGSAPVELPDATVIDGQKQPLAIVDETKVFKGTNIGSIPDAEELKDAHGSVVGWKRPWGKGRLIAYSIIPDSYGANPHPSRNLSAWMKQLIATAGLRSTGRWSSGKIEPTDGGHGGGSPVVEVVVRVKKGNEAKEKFVFVLNQGGAGEGSVEVPVGEGSWMATDALTGHPADDVAVSNGVLSKKLTVKPWEYRIFHLVAK